MVFSESRGLAYLPKLCAPLLQQFYPNFLRIYSKYHIVWVPKSRRKIVYGKLRQDIGAILRRLCQYKGVEVMTTG